MFIDFVRLYFVCWIRTLPFLPSASPNNCYKETVNLGFILILATNCIKEKLLPQIYPIFKNQYLFFIVLKFLFLCGRIILMTLLPQS